VRNTLKDEKMKEKISQDERTKLEEKIKELQSWVDMNPHAEESEYSKRQKELEDMFNPIMTRVY